MAGAAVVSAAAAAVVLGPAGVTDGAAERSAGGRSGPARGPIQAATVTTSSTATPTPVQSCQRRCSGSGVARWRALVSLMSAQSLVVTAATDNCGIAEFPVEPAPLRAAPIGFSMAVMDTMPPDRDLAAIGLLQDPVRRALHGHVSGAEGEVSRNQAAAAVGVQRGLAAFHLDKLVQAGLLEASFRRLGERRGPGAGRPAKLYRRASGEVAASLPPRTYETAAHLLAEAVEQTGADLELQAAARRAGQRAGRQEVTAGLPSR